MKRKFKIQFKKRHAIVLLICILVTTLTMILESKIETHALNVDTQFQIIPGSLTFYKDTTTTMDPYFGYSADSWTGIDIGNHTPSLVPMQISSPSKQRFTVSDMAWNPFVITVQTSPLVSSWGMIPASAIGYTGTAWIGTWKILTAAPTNATDIGTSPITFVARQNEDGLSVFSQEIVLKVTVPAAQEPWTYAGILTFTY